LTPSPPPSPPDDALGAELVWWREDGDRHTLLTIHGPLFADVIGAERVGLTLVLHDVNGKPVTSWQHELGRGETLFFDSRTKASELPPGLTEGVLVVWVGTPLVPSKKDLDRARHYERAMSMVDWFSDRGELVSLHADQSIVSKPRSLELTEMVFLETPRTRTFLVIINGREEQKSGALRLVLRNRRGDEREIRYPRVMAPFSVHEIMLGELVEDLASFCDGVEATVSGSFEARGIFTRPYVMTEGEITSGYHGGDRYVVRSIPRLVHRVFPFAEANDSIPREVMLVTSQKEMNPAYAVHGRSLTTRVHLFQSHGDLDGDFFVDLRLYDTDGRLVVHRERWTVAPRRGVSSHDLAEVLPCGGTFEGHLALSFSDDSEKQAFPHHLQALLEYRTGISVARTMLWSDRWNPPDRVGKQRVYRAAFRVFARGDRMSTLAITNPSVAPDYPCTAPYAVRLVNARGEELVHHGELAPHATRVATIAELFPDRFDDEVSMAVVESPFDLASMHLTTDVRSGAVAAEHLLAIFECVDAGIVAPCGA
jgi:hypothetical protein